MEPVSFHNHIVPGLDLLIGDPDFLMPKEKTKPKAKCLHVPSYYIYRVEDFYNEDTTRGESCRTLTRIFGVIAEKMKWTGSKEFLFPNGMTLRFEDVPPPERFNLRGSPENYKSNQHSSKFHAIALAKQLQDSYKKDVAIMTGSDQLATPALFNGIDVARINPDVYTGRIRVDMPADLASHWWTRKLIPESTWNEFFPDNPLVINQYVEMIFDPSGQVDSSYQNIGKFNGEAIVPLRYTRISNPSLSRIRPKTVGQAMLFDALLAPAEEIPIVIAYGKFGTGKTFCAVATGLAQALDRQYKKIFVCPRDATLGKEIGFLKGDKIDKVLPQTAPIFDNLESVIELMDTKTRRSTIDEMSSRKGKEYDEADNAAMKATVKMYRERYFEIEPIIFMGGRSIKDSFMIYDEFQDTERGQARALLSRIGDGSKIVVLGDPNQTTNPHLNKTSNGLSFSASRLAGDPLAAVIAFDQNREIVRSAAAKHIAERLNNRQSEYHKDVGDRYSAAQLALYDELYDERLVFVEE